VALTTRLAEIHTPLQLYNIIIGFKFKQRPFFVDFTASPFAPPYS
jgi:hypothetical protein